MFDSLFDGEGLEFGHMLSMAQIAQNHQNRKLLQQMAAKQERPSSRDDDDDDDDEDDDDDDDLRSPRVPVPNVRIPKTKQVAVIGEVDAFTVAVEECEREILSEIESRFHYRIKIKQPGNYAVVGGMVEDGEFLSDHYGLHEVAGDAGDIRTGAIDCHHSDDSDWTVAVIRREPPKPKIDVNEVLEKLRTALGRNDFNKLVLAHRKTMAEKRLKLWQMQLLKKANDFVPIDLTNFKNYEVVFSQADLFR